MTGDMQEDPKKERERERKRDREAAITKSERACLALSPPPSSFRDTIILEWTYVGGQRV
jgi:hypothetical protein